MFDSEGNIITTNEWVEQNKLKQQEKTPIIKGETYYETQLMQRGYSLEEAQAETKKWDALEKQWKAQEQENIRRAQLTPAERVMEDFYTSYQQGARVDVDEILKANHKYNQKHVRELTHKLSHIDSTEQHVFDLIDNFLSHSPDKDKIMTIEEAREYAKEKGVDYNPKGKSQITKYEVDKIVNREIVRKSTQQELAFFMQDHDYTHLNRVGQALSTLSGSVGALELAGYGIVSWLGGLGLEGLIARGAVLGKSAADAYRGATAAKMAILAQKRYNTLKEAGKEVLIANDRLQRLEKGIKARQAIGETGNFWTKVGYDTARFYKPGAPGGAASLGSTMVPFALDGAITDVPRELIELTHSQVFNTGEYGPKELIRDNLLSVGISGALPVAGKVIKGVSKGGVKLAGAGWEVTENAINKVRNDIENKKLDEIVKNRDLIADRLEGFKPTDKTMQQIAQDLQQEFKIPDAIIEAADQIDKANLTREEMLQCLQAAIDYITIENANISINSRPAFMSTLGKMYDTLLIANQKGKTIEEAWADLEQAGIVKIKRDKSNVNSKFELTPEAEIEEAFNRMEYTYYDAAGQVVEDRGFLGTKKIKALTHSDVDYVTKNLYIANMIPETELGKQAAQNLINYRNRIADATDHLTDIINRYNDIVEINNTKDYPRAKQLIHDTGYILDKNYDPSKHPFGTALPDKIQKELYPIAYEVDKEGKKIVTAYGSLEDAVQTVMENLIPNSLREKVEEAKDILKTDRIFSSVVGHESGPEVKEAEEFLKDFKSKIQDIFLTKFEKEYTNENGTKYIHTTLDLVPFKYGTSALTGGAKATRSARLEEIRDLLDDIVKNNDDLLTVEKSFQDQLPTPEEVVTGTKTIADTSRAAALLNNPIDALTFQSKLKSGEAHYDRYITFRYELKDTIEKTPEAQKVLGEILPILQKGKDNKTIIAGDNIAKIINRIPAFDELMTDKYGIIVETLVEKFKTSKVFTDLAAKPYLIEKQAWASPKAKAEFKKLFIETLDETINLDRRYTQYISEAKFQELYNRAVDRFEEYLKTNKKEGVKKLFTPHEYNAELNSKEEIANEMLGKNEQDKILTDIIDPFIEGLTQEIMDEQARNYDDYIHLLNFVDKCLEDPAHIDEALIGEYTMTPIEGKGFSLSRENLANPAEEQIALFAALEKNDMAAINDGVIPQAIAQNKDFEPLQKWVTKPENMPDLTVALYDTNRFNKGLMNEEEVALFNKQNNKRSYRAAKEVMNLLAKLQNDLFNAGSNKTDLLSLIDPSKLKEITYQGYRNMLGSSFANSIRRHINIGETTKDFAYINKYLPRLVTPLKNKNEFIADTECILHYLEILDLNKEFNSKRDLNRVRDALLSPEGLDSLIKSKENPMTHGDIEYALKEITDRFLGVPGQDVGFLHRIRGDLNLKQDVNTMSFKARYLEDIEKPLYYKNNEAELEDLKAIGFDNFKAFFDHNVGGAKKALATLTKLGAEPVQDAINKIQLAKEIARTIVPKTHGFEKAKKLQNKLNPTWERSVMFNMHNVCGTYTIPANKFARWAQLVIRVLTSPMLANAGFKSLSDYNYQTQYLVQGGLAMEGDLGARWRVGSQVARYFTTDKNLADDLYMKTLIRSDAIYSMVYNTSLATGEQSLTGVNKYAPALLKAEAISRKYTDFMLNKLFWIEPLTNYNRENAALTTMKAIASFAPVRYKDMPERLQNTLLRFGISDYEWDNIFSKHIVANSKDYIYEMSGRTVSPEFSDYKMFFPQLVDKISDDDLKQMMKDQKISITDMSMQKYRRYLKDKASVLINSSADEMTSIPTSRIQGFMSAHSMPNSGLSTFLNAVLQFQSFGAAINYYQMGRRLAHYHTGDKAFDNLITTIVSGHASPALNITQFIAESALVEFFIGEMLKELKGTNRKLVNDKGEFQGEAALDKIIEYIGAPLGIGNIALQGIWSGVTQAKGQGGGFAIPLTPAVSTASQKISKMIEPFVKKSTEGHRTKAFMGALAENITDILGAPNQPFLKPGWQYVIGDYFRESQYGNRADAIRTQRAHRGYAPSWVRHIGEAVGLTNPSDSSLLGKFLP